LSKARNRGKQSSDDNYFSSQWHPAFTAAVDDMCYLLSRDYAENSAMQIIGNRYRLNKRQRNAIARVSCSEREITNRLHSELKSTDLARKTLEVDGFNLLILLESALSGAYIFKARDGLYRDISSVHGSYKRVLRTEEAILLVGKVLKELNVKAVKWYLDQPISNSGNLKTRLIELSRNNDFNWEVELVFNPDKVLAESEQVVISSDGWILNRAQHWFNLGAYIIEKHIQSSNTLVI